MRKISSLEYNSLLWFVIRAGYIGLTLSNVINITKQDSWLTGLIALALGLVPLFIFEYLKNYDKNKNIAELNLFLFKRFGKFLNILLSIGALVFTLVAFIDLTYFVNSQFLFKTPHFIIGICFIIPIIYALFKEIGAISKTSLIMFYFVVFIIVCIIVGVISGINIESLKPFFQADINNLMHSVAIIIAYNILPMFLLTIIAKNNVQDYSSKKSLLFYFLALLSLVNAAFITITVFGTDLALLYEYPEFHLLKKVEIGDFIDRVESLFALEWIVALVILIIIGLYFVKEMIKTTFNTKEKTNKVITIILCLLLFTFNESIYITNSSITTLYKGPMVVFMFIFFLILPLIIMIKAILKKHFHN